MHISEGVLSLEVAVGGALLSAPFLYMAFKKTDIMEMPKVALMSSLFFVGSFIHVPLGATNIHLVLSGLIGVFLGVEAFLAILVALVFQALMFGYGGFSTLGVNLFTMAFPALISFYLYSFSNRVGSFAKRVLYFACGFVSLFLSALLLSLFLAFSGEQFLEAAKISFIANIPVMVLEGIITLFVIEFVKKSHPEFLERR